MAVSLKLTLTWLGYLMQTFLLISTHVYPVLTWKINEDYQLVRERMRHYIESWKEVDAVNEMVLRHTAKGTLKPSGSMEIGAQLIGSMDKKTHLPDTWRRDDTIVKIFEFDVDVFPQGGLNVSDEDGHAYKMTRNGCCSGFVTVTNQNKSDVSTDFIVHPAWDFMTKDNPYTLYHPQSKKIKMGIKLEKSIKPEDVTIDMINETKLQYVKLNGMKPPLMTTKMFLDDKPEKRMPRKPYVSCIFKNKTIDNKVSQFPTPQKRCLEEEIPEHSYAKNDFEAFFENVGQYVYDNTSVELVIDLAAVLRATWPNWARTWTESGDRPHGWPSDDIKSRGGIVVRKICAECDPKQEWRLGFPYGQRRLIETMKPQQHVMIVVLKSLRRQYFTFEKGVDSFHIENFVFWMVEKTPPSDWTDDKMPQRIFDALKELQQKVESKNLPNYFMPDVNIFDNFLAVDETIEVIDWILGEPAIAFHENLLNMTFDLQHVEKAPYALFFQTKDCPDCDKYTRCTEAEERDRGRRSSKPCERLPIYRPVLNLTSRINDSYRTRTRRVQIVTSTIPPSPQPSSSPSFFLSLKAFFFIYLGISFV